MGRIRRKSERDDLKKKDQKRVHVIKATFRFLRTILWSITYVNVSTQASTKRRRALS